MQFICFVDKACLTRWRFRVQDSAVGGWRFTRCGRVACGRRRAGAGARAIGESACALPRYRQQAAAVAAQSVCASVSYSSRYRSCSQTVLDSIYAEPRHRLKSVTTLLKACAHRWVTTIVEEIAGGALIILARARVVSCYRQQAVTGAPGTFCSLFTNSFNSWRKF